jgi:hypothetical protein
MRVQYPELLSPAFTQFVYQDVILSQITDNGGKEIHAECLGYLLPMLEFETCPLPEVQKLILKVFRQLNFSSSTYVLSIGQLIEKIQATEPKDQRLLASNLEFWREVILYLDKVDLRSFSEVKQMQQSLLILAKEIPELDFSAANDYLEYAYLKPVVRE